MEMGEVIRLQPQVAKPYVDIDAESREAYALSFELPFVPAFKYAILLVALLSGVLTFAVLCGLFGPPVHRVITVTILSATFLVSGALFVAIRILEPKAGI